MKGKDGNNVYPPCPIRVLAIMGIVEGQTFNLSFTSPGDDLNSGILHKIIVFYASNKTDLTDLTPSSNVGNITQDMLSSNTSMESLPPFSKVNLQIVSINFESDISEFMLFMLAKRCQSPIL